MILNLVREGEGETAQWVLAFLMENAADQVTKEWTPKHDSPAGVTIECIRAWRRQVPDIPV